MRSFGFDLVGMTTEYSQPVVARRLKAGAEPIWGKALYVLNEGQWAKRALPSVAFRDECLAGLCLYALFDLPDRALEVAALGERLRASSEVVATVPWCAELLKQFKALHGEVVAMRVAKRVWHVLPAGVRSSIGPLLRNARP